MDQRLMDGGASGDRTGEARAAVSVHAEGVLRIAEIAVPSPATADAMFDRVDELSAGWSSLSLLVDLGRAGRPDALTRARIVDRMRQARGLEHAVLVTGGHVLIRIALKFMLPRIPGVRFSICETVEQGLRALEEGSR